MSSNFPLDLMALAVGANGGDYINDTTEYTSSEDIRGFQVISEAYITSIHNEDYIVVTFTPTGDIDISVNISWANFTDVKAGSSDNAPKEPPSTGYYNSYTIHNAGEVAAKISVNTNTTTDTSLWTNSGAAGPPLNCYSIYIENSTSEIHYFKNDSSVWYPSLAADGSFTFGLRLNLGYAGDSSRFAPQKTQLNFTAIIVP